MKAAKTGIIRKLGENCKHFYDRELDKLDWCITLGLLMLCFFSFCHGDIVVTGNRSFLFHTHFFDFYDACYEWTQDLGANYLPSTFWLFAIWTLPLRILGRTPDTLLNNSAMNTMWFKLLPVLFYFATAIIIEKIAILVGMDERKARLCKYAFLACPIAVFSQFIFGQYDIFTIFFMMLGVYYFLKDDHKRFVLFFAIAATFKYQALVFFLIFLVLKEKRVYKIVENLFFVLIPLIVEVVMFIPSKMFRQSVFGFGALSYVNTGIDLGGIKPISPFLLLCILLLAMAYFVKLEEGKISLFRWMVFFANGIAMAFFGFISFNPQWILMIAPFWIFGILISNYSRILALIEAGFIIVYYDFVVGNWVGGIDEFLFQWTIFKKVFPTNWAHTMRSFYRYTNYTYVFTVIFAVLLLIFIMSHPKFQQKDLSKISVGTKGNLRLAFVASVLAWAIPAFTCLITSIGR